MSIFTFVVQLFYFFFSPFPETGGISAFHHSQYMEANINITHIKSVTIKIVDSLQIRILETKMSVFWVFFDDFEHVRK